MTAAVQRRPRRIAADEAHAWARNLRLGNPLAKLVLSMTTLYVNGEGSCFVSVDQLSEDCEVAQNTIRSRLAWLESIGAIARLPQWIDEHGRRNMESRGRRTTDEIRLLLNANPDEIESRAAGRATSDGGNPGDDSPARDEGSAVSADPSRGEGQSSASPAPALQRPFNSVQGLTSEPEPEVYPPNPPSGGGHVLDQDLEDTIADFQKNYPAPITNLPRLRTLLQAMTPDERRKLLTAAKGYAGFIAQCERKGKRRAVKDADRWVANGLWQGYVVNGEQVEERAQRVTVEADSDEGHAWVNLCLVGRAPRPMLVAGGYSLRRALTPQELAFIDLPPDREWAFLLPDQDAQKIGAWREFIGNALHGINRGDMLKDRGVGADMRRGVLVPWPWPPRKDGSLCTGPPTE